MGSDAVGAMGRTIIVGDVHGCAYELDDLLDKLAWILDGLVVYPANMELNLEKTRGLIYSSRVLLALDRKSVV